MSIEKENFDASGGQQLEQESSNSLIDIGYPLHLTPRGSTTKIDADLSPQEMWTLQNTLRFLKSSWNSCALQLFVDFYTENHDHINRFRSQKTGKICTIRFSEHAKMVFSLFKDITTNGFKNWEKSKNQISNLSKAHVARGISMLDLTLMADAFKSLILEKCDGVSSPTLVVALDKLFRELFEKHKAREIVASDDVSIDLQE